MTSRALSALRKMAPGTMGGESRIATPVAPNDRLVPMGGGLTPPEFICTASYIGNVSSQAPGDICGWGLSPDASTLYAICLDTPGTADGKGGIYEFEYASGLAPIGINEERYDYSVGGDQTPIGEPVVGSHVAVGCDGSLYWMENIHDTLDTQVLKKTTGGAITSTVFTYAANLYPQSFNFNPIDGRLWVHTETTGLDPPMQQILAVDMSGGGVSTVASYTPPAYPYPYRDHPRIASDGGVWFPYKYGPSDTRLVRWDPISETYAVSDPGTYDVPGVGGGSLIPLADGSLLFTVDGVGYSINSSMVVTLNDCAAAVCRPASPAIVVPCWAGGGPYAVGRQHSTLTGSVYFTNRGVFDFG